MIWRIFILVALSIVAAVTLFSRRERPDTLPRFPTSQPLQPGYFMTEATITQTGPDGLPLYRMRAERIQQNPETQSITLENLRFVYTNGEWILTADRGYIPSVDVRTIDLRGDVQIVGRLPSIAGGRGEETAIVRTPSLKVDAATGAASTRDRVDVIWGSRQLSATGLSADLKAERLTLESSVHGRFIQ